MNSTVTIYSDPLHTSVSTLHGVGKQTLLALKKLHIHNLFHLVCHLPNRYQDATKITPMNALISGSFVVVEGILSNVRHIKGKRSFVQCQLHDHTGSVALLFFHVHPGLKRALSDGNQLRCYGDLTDNQRQDLPLLIQPRCDLANTHGDLPALDQTLTAIYPLTEGLTQKRLSKLVQEALRILSVNIESLDHLSNLFKTADLVNLLKHYELEFPDFLTALKTIHTPLPGDKVDALMNRSDPAVIRLILEECIAHQLLLRKRRFNVKQYQSPCLSFELTLKTQFYERLSFELTNAQQVAITTIEQDLQQTTPMMRLLQGDVGSGKTVVAAHALLQTASQGYQAVLMVPTEIIAEQHYQQLVNWFSALSIHTVCLTGKLSTLDRNRVLEEIQSGDANIIVGTHALFQSQIQFKSLGFVCVDEQHRFGVKQRLALLEKGVDGRHYPHQLIMSATPIPRTLSMVQYADLDYTALNELPKGRKAIQTAVLPNTRRDAVIERIKGFCENNQQVYWICPLIDESESLQCQTVSQIASQLQRALPAYQVGSLHSRVSIDKKNAIMQDFVNNSLQILVATTVVEVGVNVPNATLIVIENAERMGLSQLHQLRGRVGRGDLSSFCLLLYQPPLNDLAKARLHALRDTQDGFELAEKDLKLRGQGDWFGTRQSGEIPFKLAQLPRDEPYLELARELADHIAMHEPLVCAKLNKRWELGKLVVV